MRSKLLANRFREVILNGKLVAYTNFHDQLSQVSWKEAKQKVGPLNTIAALTFHVNYYISGVLDFFEKGELTIRDKFSFDMPPINKKEDWENLKSDLFDNAEKYAEHLENMTDEKMQEFFVKEEYGTYEKNINLMIEHCYYHLGQISLIRKMM